MGCDISSAEEDAKDNSFVLLVAKHNGIASLTISFKVKA